MSQTIYNGANIPPDFWTVGTLAENFSLSWLYRHRDLRLRPVRGGDALFTGVQPSELIDTAEFVQDGSVILTVGVALPGDPAEVHAYVRRLAEAGAVAIGFGTGLRFPEVPDVLLDAVDACGIALFEVPREIPFTSLLSTVAEERSRRRMLAQQRLLDVQEVLNDVAVQRGIADLVSTAAAHLRAGVIIADNDHRVVATTGTGTEQEDLEQIVEKTLREGGRSTAFRRGGRHVVVHRMNGEGERFHLLAAVSAEPLSAEDRAVVKHCAGLADIILQRPESLRRANRDLNTLALSLLLGVEEGQEVMGSIFSPAADSTGRVRPVVVHADDGRTLQTALEALDKKLSRLGRHMFVLGLGDNASLMVFRGSRTMADTLSLFGDGRALVRIALGAPLPWHELNMRIVRELLDVAVTLQNGEHADPDSRSFRWLTDPAVRDALHTRYMETVQRLVDHDAETQGDLTRTLTLYLRSGNHLAATAEELGIHRHTLRSRLEAVERICEVDLSSPQVSGELLVLVLAHHT